MPKPAEIISPQPEPRKGPQKAGLAPSRLPRRSQISGRALWGQPTKVEITMRLVLPRVALERLSARAIRDGRKVEALVAEILGREK